MNEYPIIRVSPWGVLDMNNFRLGLLFPGMFFLCALSLSVNADPCNPGDSDADPQACLEQLASGSFNPLAQDADRQDDEAQAASGDCRDASRRTSAEGFCFDAYFETAHDSQKIDMTVYVPDRFKLAAAANVSGSVSSATSAPKARQRPRCKGCKVQRRAPQSSDRARCRGCKVKYYGRRGVPFENTAASDGQSDLGFAPLIVHSHGFGGSKQANLEEPGAIVAEQAARDLWKAGYFVISFSQRGFGASKDANPVEGDIGMMDPMLEGYDVNEVVDWAIKHLRDGIYEFQFDEQNPQHISSVITASDWDTPSLLMGADLARLKREACAAPNADKDCSDPQLGSTGYSYGGGFQFTGTHVADNPTVAAGTNTPDAGGEPMYDHHWIQRWEAINPQGTWFDLRYSLSHHDVPKSAWISVMSGFALQGGQEVLPPTIAEGLAEATLPPNRVRGDLLTKFMVHSSVNYCDYAFKTRTKGVDIFQIQGLQDTLFNFNEGYNNAKCFQDSDAALDVRFLAVTGGHLLPAISPANYSGNTGMSIDEVVHCGYEPDGLTPKRYVVKDMIFDWYENKLRGGPEPDIPNVCIVQENLDESDLLQDDDFHPECGFRPAVANPNPHRYPKEGLVYDSLDDIIVGGTEGAAFTNVPLVTAKAGATSAFVCLHEAAGPELLAGIPTLTATACLEGGAAGSCSSTALTDPTYFAGIGVVRGAGDGSGDTCDAASPAVGLDSTTGLLDNLLPPALEPLTGPVTEGLSPLTNSDIELLHDQLIAIRNGVFPDKPGATDPGRNNTYTAALGEITTNDGTTTISFGCEPNDPDGCEGGRMAGVSARLEAGDQVGLYLFGCSPQYVASCDTTGEPLLISGEVKLPIVTGVPGTVPSNHPPGETTIYPNCNDGT